MFKSIISAFLSGMNEKKEEEKNVVREEIVQIKSELIDRIGTCDDVVVIPSWLKEKS